MESGSFDRATRAIGRRLNRRSTARVLGGLLVMPFLHGTAADAKRKKNKKKKRKGGGKGGDTPPACVPNCGGANATCGSSDGCGRTCGCTAGWLCDRGTCQPCNVVHDGNDFTSGETLRQKLKVPLGDERILYVCPGRYVGYFEHVGGNLIGAGDGEDPATNTILDAAGLPVPHELPKAVFAVSPGAGSWVVKVRITGSTRSLTHGVTVPTGSGITMDTCTVTGNMGPGVSGINAWGPFTLDGCTISNNGSTDDLGFAYHGGGIRVSGEWLSEIFDSTITGNVAGGSGGGGLYVENGPLTIRNTEISENTVHNSVVRGGGIYQVGGSIRLAADTRIITNTAGTDGRGGGIYRLSGEIIWEGPTVTQNSPDNCVGVSQCVG